MAVPVEYAQRISLGHTNLYYIKDLKLDHKPHCQAASLSSSLTVKAEPRLSQTDPTEPEWRQGVVAVVIIDSRFLVIKRSQAVVAPGAFCFPGGAIEPGETESDALRREMMEELSASAQPVRLLWRSETRRRVRLGWWLTCLETHQTLAPNPAEVESVHWMTREKMLALPELLDSNREFLTFFTQDVAP